MFFLSHYLIKRTSVDMHFEAAGTPLTDEETDVLVVDETDEEADKGCFLILHNDDYNTFEFVIECLIEVCQHTPEQAEQCAYITHTRGKCDVKKGSRSKLEPMKDALQSRGLSVTID